MAANYGSVPFAEQINFFLAKTPVPTARWNDLQRDAHDSQFMVAGAMKADLLADLQAAMSHAHTEGTTLRAFIDEFERIVAKHGWTGWTGENTPAGRAWRARVIYDTNLRTSYQAGRWQQIQAAKSHRPYLLYRHSHAVVVPRDEHLAWDGMVFPVDSDWVKTHYPPNGFGCRCKMFALSRDDLAKMGKSGPDEPPYPYDGSYDWIDPKTGKTHTFPNGVQPFWDYIPGTSLTDRAKTQVDRKMQALPEALSEPLAAAIRRGSTAHYERAVLALGVKQATFASRPDIAQYATNGLSALAHKNMALPDVVSTQAQAFEAWSAQYGVPVASMAAAFSAHSVTDETVLFLNPYYTYWHDPAADTIKQFNAGYWSTPHVSHALHHELGHLAHFLADKTRYRGLRRHVMSHSQAAVAGKVSGYAAESPIEFVAEVFAGLMAGKTYDADIMALYQELGGITP